MHTPAAFLCHRQHMLDRRVSTLHAAPTWPGRQLGQRGDQLLCKVGVALVQSRADGQGGRHVLEAQRRLTQRAHHLRYVLKGGRGG